MNLGTILPIREAPKLQQPTPFIGGATDGDGLYGMESNSGGLHVSAIMVDAAARRGRVAGRALVDEFQRRPCSGGVARPRRGGAGNYAGRSDGRSAAGERRADPGP